MSFENFFEPFNEECAENGDFGEDHREDHGDGFRYAEIGFQNRRQPSYDTVADKCRTRRANASEDKDKNEIFREELDLGFFCRGSRGGNCRFRFKNSTFVMERIFRAANTEEPCERNDEYESGSKIENDTPRKTECTDTCGDTIANEIAEAVRHAVPDDRASDIFCGKEFRLNIQNIAPKRALRDTVDEPDIFHRCDIGRDGKTEITER